MPKGRHSTLIIRLTLPEYQALTTAATSPETQAPYRARMVLLRAAGHTITHIAHTVGLSRVQVYKWLRRFVTHGVEGLENRLRRHQGPRREGGNSMHGPPYAANTYATEEHRRLFREPLTAVTILARCAEELQGARQFLDEDDPSGETRLARLHLEAARHHLRQALALLPKMAPEAEGG
jgi:Helix-turn-helix domain